MKSWIVNRFGRWELWIHGEKAKTYIFFTSAERHAYRSLPINAWEIKKRTG